MTPDQAMKELSVLANTIYPNTPNELASPEANTAKLKEAIEAMLQRQGFPITLKLNSKEYQASKCRV